MFPGWSVVLQAQTPEPDCPGLNSVVLGKLFNFPVSCLLIYGKEIIMVLTL